MEKLMSVMKMCFRVPVGLIVYPLALDLIEAAERRWPESTVRFLERIEEDPRLERFLVWLSSE
jgi:hypothetical protein